MTTTTEIILAVYKVLYNSPFLLLLVAALVTVLGGIRHSGRLMIVHWVGHKLTSVKGKFTFPLSFFLQTFYKKQRESVK